MENRRTHEITLDHYDVREILELNNLHALIEEYKNLPNPSHDNDFPSLSAHFARLTSTFEAHRDLIHKYSKRALIQSFARCTSKFITLLTSYHAVLGSDCQQTSLDHVSENSLRALAPPPSPKKGQGDASLPASKDTLTRPEIDSLPYTLVLLDLKKPPLNPYNGEPDKFNSWFQPLMNKLKRLEIIALDAIEILKAHTTGGPRKLINMLSSNFNVTPETQLHNIQIEFHRRYGSPRQIAECLYAKLTDFPPMEGYNDSSLTPHLRKFSDICLFVSYQMDYCEDLGFLNTSFGLDPIRKKLPIDLIRDWRTFRADYMDANSDAPPPFTLFCDFIRKKAHELSLDIGFNKVHPQDHQTIDCAKVLITAKLSEDHARCILHRSSAHQSTSCRYIRQLSERKRRLLAFQNKLCFNCLSNKHIKKDCTRPVNRKIDRKLQTNPSHGLTAAYPQRHIINVHKSPLHSSKVDFPLPTAQHPTNLEWRRPHASNGPRFETPSNYFRRVGSDRDNRWAEAEDGPRSKTLSNYTRPNARYRSFQGPTRSHLDSIRNHLIT